MEKEMNILNLEKIAQREKIDIINFKMKKTKAKIVEYDNTYIFMDYSNIHTYTEEKCLLAEELRSLLLLGVLYIML